MVHVPWEGFFCSIPGSLTDIYLQPCSSSLAVWDRRAAVCQLCPCPSPASTALGLIPVYAHRLMELSQGFILLPSWKWEAHHEESVHLLPLTFPMHWLSFLLCQDHPALPVCPKLILLSCQTSPVAVGCQPHTIFPWDIVSLETPAHPGTFTQLLLLLAMPKPHSGIWSSGPSPQEVFLSQPGPFPVPAPHPSQVPQGSPSTPQGRHLVAGVPMGTGILCHPVPSCAIPCHPALIPAQVSPGAPGAKAIVSLRVLPHTWHVGSMGQEPGLRLSHAPGPPCSSWGTGGSHVPRVSPSTALCPRWHCPCHMPCNPRLCPVPSCVP